MLRMICNQLKCRGIFPQYLGLTMLFGVFADLLNRAENSLFGWAFIHLFIFANGG